MRRKAILLNTIARAMNAGGTAIVSVYDAGAAAVTGTMSALSRGERTTIGGKIKTLEKKILALTVEIAKETAKYPDTAEALQAESVTALHTTIMECKNEIEQLKERLAEIDNEKSVKKPQRESTRVSGSFVSSLSKLLPGEKAKIKVKIIANEKIIQNLYCAIANEMSKQPDPSDAIISEVVVGFIAKINELNAEIASLNQRKIEIAELKKPERAQTNDSPKERSSEIPEEHVVVTEVAPDTEEVLGPQEADGDNVAIATTEDAPESINSL